MARNRYMVRIGIDEVGRGAWAGPMLFVAIALNKPINGLKDSKKLTKKQRDTLAKTIINSAQYIGYGWVTASEIDDLGLTQASELACKRAINNAPKNSKIYLDGKVNYLKDNPNVDCIVNGDDLVPEISAAGILAKVTRDRYMRESDKQYPNYGFANNVGYGTSAHISAIKINGLTPLHRWSFKPIRDFTENLN